MIDPPQVVESPAQHAAVIHVTVSRDEIRTAMGAGYRELMATLAAQGISPTGPWFTHHLRSPGDTFDFELGVPVGSAVAAAGRMKPGQLPAGRVARTVYHGPYEGLAAGWGELMAWIKAQGHAPAADFWEIYAVGPETEPDATRYRTGLNRPLARTR